MKKEFPIRLRRGSVEVKIYRQVKKGYCSFTLRYYENSKPIRRTFADLKEVREEATNVLDRLTRSEEGTLILSGADQFNYLHVTERLRQHGLDLVTVMTEAVQLQQLLGGKATPLEAGRFFEKHNCEHINRKRVQEVVDELITTREKDHSSLRHIADLRSRLNRFAKDFQCDIASVTASNIQDFLLSLGLAQKSQKNFRTAISNLFSFARLKQYVSKKENIMDEVPAIKEPDRDVGIYTPEQLKLLLSHASKKFLPYVVVAAFSGLRQSEIERLTWEHVGEDYIRVPGGERRTKSKRVVKIQENLKKWLAQVRQLAGPIAPFSNISNQITNLCKKAGVPSRHNGFRHSFGSYRLALVQDTAKVAEEMGNSPRMVKKHYLEVVIPETAQAWFDISPENTTTCLTVAPQNLEEALA